MLEKPHAGLDHQTGDGQAAVELYWRPGCPYCMAAEHLLRRKGVQPIMIRIDHDPGLREEMIRRSAGRTTVPQIFIAGRHIGGCDELHALEERGALEPLLRGAT